MQSGGGGDRGKSQPYPSQDCTYLQPREQRSTAGSVVIAFSSRSFLPLSFFFSLVDLDFFLSCGAQQGASQQSDSQSLRTLLLKSCALAHLLVFLLLFFLPVAAARLRAVEKLDARQHGGCRPATPAFRAEVGTFQVVLVYGCIIWSRSSPNCFAVWLRKQWLIGQAPRCNDKRVAPTYECNSNFNFRISQFLFLANRSNWPRTRPCPGVLLNLGPTAGIS